MHWSYHSFILCAVSYMFRQYPAIIRDLIRSTWVTWNTNQVGGISYNVWLRDISAYCWFLLICEDRTFCLSQWLQKIQAYSFDCPDIKAGMYKFSKNRGLPQNSRRHEDDVKQVPYWGNSNIRRYRTKFKSPRFVHPYVLNRRLLTRNFINIHTLQDHILGYYYSCVLLRDL
jgi:hypothetical protein